MILAQQSAPIASVSFARSAAEDGGALIKTATSKKEPEKERFTSFRFTQKILSWEGGNFKLRLKEFPTLLLDPNSVKMQVKDWGFELNAGSVPELPKHIVRRFLSLWSKAQNGALTEADADSWEKILGLVDMQDFAVQQTVPRYVEGQLVANQDVLRVRWHDGTFAYIPRELTCKFDLLNEGEFFSAYVKFGRSDEPLSIERVLPISAPLAA